MRTIACMFLTLSIVGVSGCLPEAFLQGEPNKSPKTELKLPPPPAVLPDAVTEKNAQDKARELRQELEHEMLQQAGSAENSKETP